MAISSNERTERLWTFESPLEAPSSEELIASWQKYHQTEVRPLDSDSLGLLEIPDKAPRAIVSLDLCEVLRQTGLSLEGIHNPFLNLPANFAQDYEINDLYESWQGDTKIRTRNVIMTQQLMYFEQVSPVPYHEAIQAFLQRWQHNGIYVIANTSTLPGCEISTIKFLADTYPNSLRGILLPGNHDGLGTTTKADILQQAKRQLSRIIGTDVTTVPTIAIEDAWHHGKNYVESEDQIDVFMPAYKWNEPLENTPSITRVAQQFGTLDTFIAADNYFVDRDILK